ncbi:hypothetical protein ACHQM5_030155 [Ranunculus cassubicifolius]
MKKSKKITAELPDEILLKILESGIQNSILSRSDVLSFSSCCKSFNKLSNEESIWSSLVTLDFPGCINRISNCSKKDLYKCRLQRYKQIFNQLKGLK